MAVRAQEDGGMGIGEWRCMYIRMRYIKHANLETLLKIESRYN